MESNIGKVASNVDRNIDSSKYEQGGIMHDADLDRINNLEVVKKIIETADNNLLLDLAGSNIRDIRVLVAKSKNASEIVLNKLAQYDDEEVLLNVIKNPNTTTAVLYRLKNKKSRSIRVALAANPLIIRCPELYFSLLRDKDWEVRLGLVNNKITPITDIIELMFDGSKKVSKAAKQRVIEEFNIQV